MTSRLEIFTNVPVMFIVQLLGPSLLRCESSMDVTVVVVLASRIQDLLSKLHPRFDSSIILKKELIY